LLLKLNLRLDEEDALSDVRLAMIKNAKEKFSFHNNQQLETTIMQRGGVEGALKIV